MLKNLNQIQIAICAQLFAITWGLVDSAFFLIPNWRGHTLGATIFFLKFLFLTFIYLIINLTLLYYLNKRKNFSRIALFFFILTMQLLAFKTPDFMVRNIPLDICGILTDAFMLYVMFNKKADDYFADYSKKFRTQHSKLLSPSMWLLCQLLLIYAALLGLVRFSSTFYKLI